MSPYRARANPRLGDAPLFPGVTDVTKPIRKHVAAHWLHRAETLAGLPRLEGGAYHPFRRLWASERRHLPAQDVAAAGGWKSLTVMRTAYQHADAATMYSVTDLRSGGHTPDTPAREGEARHEVK